MNAYAKALGNTWSGRREVTEMSTRLVQKMMNRLIQLKAMFYEQDGKEGQGSRTEGTVAFFLRLLKGTL